MSWKDLYGRRAVFRRHKDKMGTEDISGESIPDGFASGGQSMDLELEQS